MIAAPPDRSLVGIFEALAPLFAGSRLDWRRSQLASFEARGVPTKRDEEFKYLPLNALTETAFGVAYGATIYREDLVGIPVASLNAYRIAFINGEFAPELSHFDELAALASVVVGPEFVDAIGEIAQLDGRLGSTNDLRFVHLANAFAGDGVAIRVPRGTIIEKPIHILNLTRVTHEPFVAFPRCVIELEVGAQAKVVESYIATEPIQTNPNQPEPYFNNAVFEVSLDEGAILEHTRVQLESADAIHIGNTFVKQASSSTYTSTAASFGGKISRHDIYAFVDGERCETWLNGTYIGRGTQIHDNHTRIDHAKPNCHSFEVYKGILADESVGVFNGKIFVYEDAQKTDAKQTNQALLLSPKATINTKPQLEIFADDVKCTHGATIGQLREDAMFYLRARGIPAAEARAMLVQAFAAQALDRISIGALRELIEAEIAARLASG